MSEALIKRVARLVGGTFTSIVDAAENAAPSVVVREAIEEIDSAIEEVRTEIGRQQATRHNANRELENLNKRTGDLEEQIQTAIAEKRDDLAEAATDELLGVEDRIPLIETHVANASSEEAELQKYLSGLRAKREEMEADLREIREHQADAAGETIVTDGENASGSNVERRVERAGNAVDRVKSSITGLPSGKDRGDAKAMAELEELHRRNRVKERLELLKKAE